MKRQHIYTGLWVTEDGFIRHELLPNGRYDEALGPKPVPIRATTIFVGIESIIRTTQVLQLMELLSVMTNFITREWCFFALIKITLTIKTRRIKPDASLISMKCRLQAIIIPAMDCLSDSFLNSHSPISAHNPFLSLK